MSNLENKEVVSEDVKTVAPVQVKLTVTGVQADLNNGLTREMIKAKYGLTTKDLKDLFAHPKLKGLKTKPKPGFILVDDTIGDENLKEEEVAPGEDSKIEEEVAPVEVSDEFGNAPSN